MSREVLNKLRNLEKMFEVINNKNRQNYNNPFFPGQPSMYQPMPIGEQKPPDDGKNEIIEGD